MRELILAYQQTKDIKTRNLIANHYLYLTKKLVNKQASNLTGTDKEDLEQEAALELLDVIDDYNPNKGADFVTYAYTRITGRIKQFMRDKAWLIKIPQKLYVLNGKINKAKNKLRNTLKREPTEIEIFYELGITAEQYYEAQSGMLAFTTNIISTEEHDISYLLDNQENISEFEEEIIKPSQVRCKTSNTRSAWQKIVDESSKTKKPQS